MFFSPESRVPHENFEYRTNAVWFEVAEISAKQNGTFVIGWCDRSKFSKYFKPLHILQGNQNKENMKLVDKFK